MYTTIEKVYAWPVYSVVAALRDVENRDLTSTQRLAFHYTDAMSAKAICKSRKGFRPSTGGFQDGGVFFCEDSPTALFDEKDQRRFSQVFHQFHEHQLARNYGQDLHGRLAKVDCVIVVAIDSKAHVVIPGDRPGSLFMPRNMCRSVGHNVFIKRVFQLAPVAGYKASLAVFVKDEMPPPLAGMLWKQSRSRLLFGKFQQRHVMLHCGQMAWARPKSGGEAGMHRGSIDFSRGLCLVEQVEESSVQFTLEPLGSGWISGGQERTFTFDVTGSAHSRDQWMDAIHRHVAYGQHISLTRKSRHSGGNDHGDHGNVHGDDPGGDHDEDFDEDNNRDAGDLADKRGAAQVTIPSEGRYSNGSAEEDSGMGCRLGSNDSTASWDVGMGGRLGSNDSSGSWRGLSKYAERRQRRLAGAAPLVDGDIRDHYEVDPEKLGEGTFSSVYRCRHTDSGERCVVKVLAKDHLGQSMRDDDEYTIMRTVAHPNIARAIECFEDTESAFVVLEFCSGSDLYDLVASEGRLHEETAAVILRQLLNGVAYLHTNYIMHRDIKPENALLTTTDEDVMNSTVKLIDFSSACTFMETRMPTTKVGNPYYIAPEVLEAAGPYGPAADLWSLGVLLFLLLCGYPPFNGDTDAAVLEKVRAANFHFKASHWRSVSEEAKELVSAFLDQNPSFRCTPEEALQSDWLSTP